MTPAGGGPTRLSFRRNPSMSMQLQRGQAFPDLALPDHRGQRLRLSQLTAADEFSRRLGFTAGRPLIVVFYRGFFCPRDRLQLSQLTAFHPEILLSSASLVRSEEHTSELQSLRH